ncbi:hypothetical protein HKX48_000369 [Thoreauomyces humboldtii]|nr:hypothetical protein HKX48_000369 [Thoreauomyces humboldtii]
MSCCGAASWKREHIEDHKFDLIDVDDFADQSFVSSVRYSWVFFNTLKSVLIYMADLGVVLLLVYSAINAGKPCVGANAFSSSSNTTATVDPCAPSPYFPLQINGGIRFGLTLGTISLSYILLALEWKKGLAIVRSKDISYAFTNTVAYRYYVIRSYGHFCLFSTIENSRKVIDEVAFWVFFTFRGWKRLLLAELPRQFLNFLLLWSAYSGVMSDPKSVDQPPPKWCAVDSNGKGIVDPTRGLDAKNQPQCVLNKPDFSQTFVWLMIDQQSKMAAAGMWLASATVVMWALSAVLLVCAFVVYIPLLCTIRGNLKEFCCHKVDKRIDEVLKKRSRKRAEQARKREQEEIAKYGKSNGPAPTLPDVDMVGMGDDKYSYANGSSESAQHLTHGALYGHGNGYYATSGPGSAYGGSSTTGSAYGATRPTPSPQPPMPSPYIRAGMAAQQNDLYDGRSEYNSSQVPTQYSGNSGYGASGYAPQSFGGVSHHVASVRQYGNVAQPVASSIVTGYPRDEGYAADRGYYSPPAASTTALLHEEYPVGDRSTKVQSAQYADTEADSSYGFGGREVGSPVPASGTDHRQGHYDDPHRQSLYSEYTIGDYQDPSISSSHGSRR